MTTDAELRGSYPQHVRNRPSRVAGEEGLQAFEVAAGGREFLSANCQRLAGGSESRLYVHCKVGGETDEPGNRTRNLQEPIA